MAKWIENLPEVGGRFLDRGREIEANKSRLRAELDCWLKAEAKLWAEVDTSGQWDKADVTEALLEIDPAAIKFLPDRRKG